MRILRRLLSTLIICAFVTAPATALACTLWAAAGDSVGGGGTLLGKTYDWVPDHQLQLRVLARGGYRVVSLYAVGNEHPGTRAGINEKGFVIVRASPPSYLEVPENYKGVTNVNKVLSRYAGVAEALAALEAGKWKMGPGFAVLADGKEIASVEVGLNGAYVIAGRTSSGVVYHTNHYLVPGFAAFYQGGSNSSRKRYGRIKELMAAKGSHAADDFRQYGADAVLWRTGTKPTTTRTLASWIIR